MLCHSHNSLSPLALAYVSVIVVTSHNILPCGCMSSYELRQQFILYFHDAIIYLKSAIGILDIPTANYPFSYQTISSCHKVSFSQFTLNCLKLLIQLFPCKLSEVFYLHCVRSGKTNFWTWPHLCNIQSVWLFFHIFIPHGHLLYIFDFSFLFFSYSFHFQFHQIVDPLCLVADDSIFLTIAITHLSKTSRVILLFPGLGKKPAQYLQEAFAANSYTMDRIEFIRKKDLLLKDSLQQKVKLLMFSYPKLLSVKR